MHLALNIFTIIVTWKWSDWRSWQKYHPTLLFLPMMSLVYNFLALSSEYFLWHAKPDFLFSKTVVELTYTAILLPCTVLLFLSNYPSKPVKVLLYFLKYIVIYSCVEALLYITGRFEYHNSWSIWHSVLFYCLMFPSIIIHHRKPLLAYIIFLLITFLGIWYFKVPMK